MTNNAENNEVVVFIRADGGSLTQSGSFDTGGQGSGPPANFPMDPFGSQDALILSPDSDFLFVLNAGSDEISSFSVGEGGQLTLINTVASGGEFQSACR